MNDPLPPDDELARAWALFKHDVLERRAPLNPKDELRLYLTYIGGMSAIVAGIEKAVENGGHPGHAFLALRRQLNRLLDELGESVAATAAGGSETLQ